MVIIQDIKIILIGIGKDKSYHQEYYQVVSIGWKFKENENIMKLSLLKFQWHLNFWNGEQQSESSDIRITSAIKNINLNWENYLKFNRRNSKQVLVYLNIQP